MRADLQQFLQGAVHGGIAFLHVGCAATQYVHTVCCAVQRIAHIVHALADLLGVCRLSGSALRNLVDRGIDCGNRLSDTVKIARKSSGEFIHLLHGTVDIGNDPGEAYHNGMHRSGNFADFIGSVYQLRGDIKIQPAFSHLIQIADHTKQCSGNQTYD